MLMMWLMWLSCDAKTQYLHGGRFQQLLKCTKHEQIGDVLICKLS